MRSSLASGAATTAAARNSATCVNVTSVMARSVWAAGSRREERWRGQRNNANDDATGIVKNRAALVPLTGRPPSHPLFFSRVFRRPGRRAGALLADRREREWVGVVVPLLQERVQLTMLYPESRKGYNPCHQQSCP